MAGHSQFKNIMYRKCRQDSIRAKIFSKISREITVAAKSGGINPLINARLRIAIQNAKIQSMPKNNIERAIQKATTKFLQSYEEIRYEGYMPGGIAIIIETLTNNKNRTTSNIRSSFTKFGGNLCENGSLKFLFKRVGEIIYKTNHGNYDNIIDTAIEIGAKDFYIKDKKCFIICDFDQLNIISKSISNIFGDPESIKVIWKSKNLIDCDKEKINNAKKLIEYLNIDEDIQNIFANFI